MPLGVGVAGLGVMGANHARVLSELDGTDLVGVCDVDAEKRTTTADRFDVPGFEQLEKLLAEPDLDAVVVATPTRTHRDVALETVQAGKHLLVEKPLAGTVEDAEEIVEAADDAGLVLATGHIERHNPVVAFAARALDEGRFGEVISTSARRVSRFPGRIRDVGVILDLAVHDVDVMRHLIDRPVRSVYARAGSHSTDEDLEDHANVVLAFEDGVVGVVEVNWLTPMKVRRLSLTCSESFVELDYIDQTARIASSTFGEIDPSDLYHIPLEFNTESINLQRQEPLKRELRDLAEAVREGRPPLVTGDDGVQAIEIARAALTSARTGDPVPLEGSS